MKPNLCLALWQSSSRSTQLTARHQCRHQPSYNAHLDVGGAVEDVEADEGVRDDEADAADAGAEFSPGPEVLEQADAGDGAPHHGQQRHRVDGQADHEDPLGARHQQVQGCRRETHTAAPVSGGRGGHSGAYTAGVRFMVPAQGRWALLYGE